MMSKYYDGVEFPFCNEVSKYERIAKIGQGTFGYVLFVDEHNKSCCTCWFCKLSHFRLGLALACQIHFIYQNKYRRGPITVAVVGMVIMYA